MEPRFKPDVIEWTGPGWSGIAVRNTPENRALMRERILELRAKEAAELAARPAPKPFAHQVAELTELAARDPQVARLFPSVAPAAQAEAA